ncbi:MAG: SURF1 family protein [Methylobacterium mesophilicum]|nr:SURF1 family protein [Methylobacterium mesophilicum]
MTTAASHAEKPRAPRVWLALLAAAVVFAALIGLGTWQVERLQWKEALIASIAERTSAAPRPLAEIETRFRDTGDVEYWPVTVAGTFLNDKERHFFATWQGQSGYYVYAPLALDDGRAVLVNRGFVPFELKESTKRAQGLIAGRVTVTGLARNPLAGKPSFIVPDNDIAKNIFYWKDRDRMAESAGLPTGDRLVPFFIDAGPGVAPGGWPVGGVTIVDLPNNHLQYVVTWYGLAAALVGVVIAWWLRVRRAP